MLMATTYYINYINAIYIFFQCQKCICIDINMGYSCAPFSSSSSFKALQLIYNSIHAYMHVTLHPSPTHGQAPPPSPRLVLNYPFDQYMTTFYLVAIISFFLLGTTINLFGAVLLVFLKS